MAEQQQLNVVSAAYPAPPPFYKHFTPENLRRLEELRTEPEHIGGEGSSPTPVSQLPPELRYLVPPRPPTEGTYRSFGDSYNVVESLPSLEEQGIEQLYPSAPDASALVSVDGTRSEWTLDRAFHLQKIARSLLLNFLELVGILGVNPSQYGRKVEDLRTLFVNAHHLLNEYRPHQARESLILMMEAQIRRSQAETEGIRQMKEKLDGVLRDIAQDIDEGILSQGWDEEGNIKSEGNRSLMEEHRRIWEVLRSELRT